jgi:hypothetical protein
MPVAPRRSAVSFGEEVAMYRASEEDELELALARLEWAREAHCLDIPEQARAVAWHVAACDEAQHAVPANAGTRE